jgi:hypothetical protein
MVRESTGEYGESTLHAGLPELKEFMANSEAEQSPVRDIGVVGL